MKRLLSMLVLVGGALLLAGCGQEAEVVASAEEQGFAYPEQCASCHGDDPEYQLKGARAGYEQSGHALGFALHETHSYYSNGGGCQKCHTHEGFVEFVKTGKVDDEGYVKWPSQPGCFTCHAPHKNGDFELRTTAAVALVDDANFDHGKGNLCVACHQSRRGATDVVKATPAEKVSGHFGPHHGPQGNVFSGSGAYEYAGQSYSSSVHKMEIENACVDCHMALPEKRFSSTAAIGGHAFGMKGEIHGSKKINLAACAGCHEGIKQVQGETLFDYAAAADWDQDGSVETSQQEVAGLLLRLVNDEGTGVLQTLELPMFKADGSWNPIGEEGVTRSEQEMAALFNYKFFAADRSLGIHNTPYTVQVLMDTVASLDAGFDTASRPE